MKLCMATWKSEEVEEVEEEDLEAAALQVAHQVAQAHLVAPALVGREEEAP